MGMIDGIVAVIDEHLFAVAGMDGETTFSGVITARGHIRLPERVHVAGSPAANLGAVMDIHLESSVYQLFNTTSAVGCLIGDRSEHHSGFITTLISRIGLDVSFRNKKRKCHSVYCFD